MLKQRFKVQSRKCSKNTLPNNVLYKPTQARNIVNLPYRRYIMYPFTKFQHVFMLRLSFNYAKLFFQNFALPELYRGEIGPSCNYQFRVRNSHSQQKIRLCTSVHSYCLLTNVIISQIWLTPRLHHPFWGKLVFKRRRA